MSWKLTDKDWFGRPKKRKQFGPNTRSQPKIQQVVEEEQKVKKPVAKAPTPPKGKVVSPEPTQEN